MARGCTTINRQPSSIPFYKENNMGKRQFVVTINWAWDHSNTEIATFTIEGDAEEENRASPLFIDVPLTTGSFRSYYQKHSGVFKIVFEKLRDAVNGNPMDKANLVELYELQNPHSSGTVSKIGKDRGLLLVIAGRSPLCTFGRGGDVLFL